MNTKPIKERNKGVMRGLGGIGKLDFSIGVNKGHYASGESTSNPNKQHRKGFAKEQHIKVLTELRSLKGAKMDLYKGKVVKIEVEGYDTMIGTIERIIKVKVPFGPESDNPIDWTYHINVDSKHPRNSGIFQCNLNNIKGAL